MRPWPSKCEQHGRGGRRIAECKSDRGRIGGDAHYLRRGAVCVWLLCDEERRIRVRRAGVPVPVVVSLVTDS